MVIVPLREFQLRRSTDLSRPPMMKKERKNERVKKAETKENVGVISARWLLKIAFYLVALADPTTVGRENHKSGRLAIIWCLSLFFYYRDH